MKRKKLLFLSDSVSASSGLGRITRDLALRVHQHLGDRYEVATVGYGGVGSAKYPFHQYHVHDVTNWLVPELPAVWEDFVGDGEGILFCIWDMSRLYWIGNPSSCPTPHLRRWIETAKIQKWAYHALDAEGPNGKLPIAIQMTMKGFDRVLDYSAFSSNITGNKDWLPHGIDTSVFYPRNRKAAREKLVKQGFTGLTQDSLLIGIVATNQIRKNWQLGIETCRLLLDRGHDVKIWAHIDVLDRYWSLTNLTVDYDLAGRVAVTTERFTDDRMAEMYSACDVTLGIGPEGFGYPLAESLACGTPVVCGTYGAQAEFVPKVMQVTPRIGFDGEETYYYEGAFCSKRPVHSSKEWANKVEEVKGIKPEFPDKIKWDGPILWPKWESWFKGGL